MGFFLLDGRAFLRGPVSGFVLGSVLPPIFDRKVFENRPKRQEKYKEAREAKTWFGCGRRYTGGT